MPDDLLWGYNTNGFAHHRLEDAIEVLAETGYKSVALTLDHHSLNPFAPDLPAIKLGMDAFERALGTRPILVRVGGTLPIYPALAAKGIATIGTGFALRESNVHSPNERLRVEDVGRAVSAARELYTSLAGLG